MPTIRALFDAPATSPLAEVKVANVAELLVELTDVRHQMATVQTKDGLSDKVRCSNCSFEALLSRVAYVFYVRLCTL
jgi:Nuclear condensing complex subunits, C-term domain